MHTQHRQRCRGCRFHRRSSASPAHPVPAKRRSRRSLPANLTAFTSRSITTISICRTCLPQERAKENFDDPALIESSLLAAHVAALARGQTIERPLYDFSHHIRIPDRTETMRAVAFVLVEGLFALYYQELLPLYQMRVYLDTPDDVCFDRRMRRDTLERGRTPESVRRQYEATVRPSSIAFVRPSATHADLVIDGTAALDWKVEQVLAAMRDRGLLRLPR